MTRGKLWKGAKSFFWGGTVLGLFVLAGCENNNLFGGLHRDGSGDSATLVIDGQAALGRAQYAKAQDYFTRALQQDPRNAEALYGQAAAAMGGAGLDLGQLVSNLMAGSSAAGGNAIRGALSPATRGHFSTSASDSLLHNINVEALDDALNIVIVDLEKIRLGLSDGRISPESASLLINLGMARLLKAVTAPQRIGVLDVREFSNTYTVVLTKTLDSGDCPVVEKSANNVGWGFLNLREAALRLGAVSGSTLESVQNDVHTLFLEYRGKGNPPCGGVASSLPVSGPQDPSEGL